VASSRNAGPPFEILGLSSDRIFPRENLYFWRLLLRDHPYVIRNANQNCNEVKRYVRQTPNIPAIHIATQLSFSCEISLKWMDEITNC
jgi:hypothetical protein